MDPACCHSNCDVGSSSFHRLVGRLHWCCGGESLTSSHALQESWCPRCISLGIVWQDYVGRSGLLASFSLIFASEIGDKTFFIAGLLAMRVGRTLAFTGELHDWQSCAWIQAGMGSTFAFRPLWRPSAPR